MLAAMSYHANHRLAHRPKSATSAAKRSSVSRPKARPPTSQPVDAAELTRRLAIVLAEQKARSDRKRRARAEAELESGNDKAGRRQNKSKLSTTGAGSTQAEKYGSRRGQVKEPQSTSVDSQDTEDSANAIPTTYRHVPQVAATQFELTTTVEQAAEKSDVPKVHKLSRKAMRFHLDGPNASVEVAGLNSDAAPIQHAKALKRAQSNREQQYSRNQPGRTTCQPFVPEADENLARSNQRHSSAAPGLSRSVENETWLSRRMSTGNAFDAAQAHPVGSFDLPGGLFALDEPSELGNPDEHRVDWTQSDESQAAKAADVPQRHWSPPPVRKVASIWALRGRLGSLSKHGKNEKPHCVVEEKEEPEDSSSESPKAGFFARFKR